MDVIKSHLRVSDPCPCELPGGIRILVHHAGHERHAGHSWKHFAQLEPHTHTAMHIVVLTDGENTLRHNGAAIEWTAPEGVLIDSNIPHEVRPARQGAIEYLQLTFSRLDEENVPKPSTWSELSHAVGGRSIHNERIGPQAWQRTIPDLLAAVQAMARRDSLSLSARLLAIIAGLSADIDTSVPPELDQLQQRIADDPAFGWDIDALSQACNWSTGYLHRRCRSSLECTPMDLVYQIRLEKATALLLEGTLSMDAIAEMCGFADAYHFSRRFKQRYGLPPGAWRKQRRSTARRATALIPLSGCTG